MSQFSYILLSYLLKYESEQIILVKTLSLNITNLHLGQVVVSQILSDEWFFFKKKIEDCLIILEVTQ